RYGDSSRCNSQRTVKVLASGQVCSSVDVCKAFSASIRKGMTMLLRLFTQKNRAVGMLTVVQLAVVFFLVVSSTLPALAQQPLGDKPFTNYFVTGDYVVGGWKEVSSANGFATGTISIPDSQNQPNAGSVPAGADIVAAYLYWGTVEGSQTLFV